MFLKENKPIDVVNTPISIGNKKTLSSPVSVKTTANINTDHKSHIQIPNQAPEQKSDKKFSEEECWEIVKNKYIANPNFAKNNTNILNKVVGQWYYSTKDVAPEQEESIPGKFLLAIGKAGLLEGKTIQQNIPEAIELLNDVIVADPQNSAPRIFLAIIKNKNGKKEQVQNILNQIESETTYFNSYTLNFIKALYKQIKTPEDMMAAYEIWTHTPIVNYHELGQFLKLHKIAIVAEQLLADGISERKIADDIDWLTIEYAIGKNVMNKLQPDNKYPDWKSTYQSKRKKYLNELGHASLNGECNLNILNEHVQLLPNYL